MIGRGVDPPTNMLVFVLNVPISNVGTSTSRKIVISRLLLHFSLAVAVNKN